MVVFYHSGQGRRHSSVNPKLLACHRSQNSHCLVPRLCSAALGSHCHWLVNRLAWGRGNMDCTSCLAHLGMPESWSGTRCPGTGSPAKGYRQNAGAMSLSINSNRQTPLLIFRPGGELRLLLRLEKNLLVPPLGPVTSSRPAFRACFSPRFWEQQEREGEE